MDDPTCRVDGCDHPIKVKSRKLCALHHTRFLRHGDENAGGPLRSKPGKECSQSGCSGEPKSRGMCRKHYRLALLAERPACSVDGCETNAENAGMCGMHYVRKQRGKDIHLPRRWASTDGSSCRTVGCSRDASTKGYCKSHYNYKRLTGREPVTVKPCVLCGSDMQLAPEGGRLVPMFRIVCHDCRAMTRTGRWCMTVEEIRERDGGDCRVCGETVDFSAAWPEPTSPSVDHIIPRSRGGMDRPGNIALAHLICNLKKGAKTTTE